MRARAVKRRRRRLRRRIRDLDDAIARLFKVRNRRANAGDDEGAERVMRRIRIREHRCAEAMSQYFNLQTTFDHKRAMAAIAHADELLAKYGG